MKQSAGKAQGQGSIIAMQRLAPLPAGSAPRQEGIPPAHPNKPQHAPGTSEFPPMEMTGTPRRQQWAERISDDETPDPFSPAPPSHASSAKHPAKPSPRTTALRSRKELRTLAHPPSSPFHHEMHEERSPGQNPLLRTMSARDGSRRGGGAAVHSKRRGHSGACHEACIRIRVHACIHACR